MRHPRRIITGPVIAALVVLAVGSALPIVQASGLPGGEGGKSVQDGKPDLQSTIKLDDGRRVSMFARTGKGIFEQHYSPKTKVWTKPKLIVRVRASEPCSGIKLTAHAGTVAATTSFGYCSEGETPEAFAVVGTGNLFTWEYHNDSVESWAHTRIAGKGRQVTFTAGTESGKATLKWNWGKGFSTDIPTPAASPIDRSFLGTWQTRDGAQRLTIQEPQPGKATAVFSTLRGAHCTTTAQISNSGTMYVDFDSFERTEGSSGDNCPLDLEGTALQRDTAGGEVRLHTLGVPEKTLYTYVRQS